jgi:septal ring factor EnvC (AmiA/AmiB activator)
LRRAGPSAFLLTTFLLTGLLLWAASTVPLNAQPAIPAASDLEAARRDCIAAARDIMQHEQAIDALRHQLSLLSRDVEGRRRGLAETRPEQARFLGELEDLARNPPGRLTVTFTSPIDRIRAGLLADAFMPAVLDEARTLARELERIGSLRREITTKQAAVTADQAALTKQREQLAPLIAQRLEITHRLLPEEPGLDARVAKLGHDAADLADLIKRADAETEHRDKDLLAHARAALPKAKANTVTADTADPTRPHELAVFDPPQSALTMPVSGAISRRFGASDAAAPPSDGIVIAAPPGDEVVAPFDGRVIYAGPFRKLGLVLIIRHGGLYHSVLAGLGRVDVRVDQWVLAGEPVGALPEALDKVSDSPLSFELRREGHPVDPQPWLAAREDASSEPAGEQKVRE